MRGSLRVGGGTAELLGSELELENLGARSLRGRSRLETVYRMLQHGLGHSPIEEPLATAWAVTDTSA